MVVEPQGEVAEDLEEIAVFLAFRIGRLELGLDLLQLGLELEDVVEGLRDLVVDGGALVLHALLRQVADRDLLGLDDAAVVGVIDPGDDLHQGRLARPVRTGEGPTLLRAHGEGEVPEQTPGPYWTLTRRRRA